MILTTTNSGLLGSNIHFDISLNREICNLHDYQSVLSAIRSIRPSGIVHFAGSLQPATNSSGTKHYSILDNNLRIDSNIIRAAIECEIPNLLCVSSISAYGELAALPYSESDIYLGPPPKSYFGYGVSKRLTIDLVKSAKLETGLNYKTVLLGNVYGPGGKFGENATIVGNVISKVQKCKLAGIDLELWGTGAELRSLTFVQDLPSLLSRILLDKKMSEIIKIGN